MKFILTLAAVLLLALAASACKRASNNNQARTQEPQLEVAPLAQERGQWKIATSDQVTLSVSAPGAQQVRILDRPAGADDQVELGTLTAPSDTATGKFSTELQVPPDFAGELSAEVTYPDGTTKETEAIAVTTATAAGADASEVPPHSTGGSVGTDESARSDKLTGGKIEQAKFKPGDPNIRITINVPAFQLTLWQNGKEVRTYDIGIGRKNFPLVIGEREATAVIFNPRWIPPDSPWVRRTKGVEPYERIEPGDPRNPLGKIKIPLGDGYLIHEAAKPSDIGNLVSHGCVRMLTDDLFDLSEKIIQAYGLPVTREQIKNARTNTERMVVELDAPLLVDINYDPQVIEGDVLYLYPDVYERGAFSVESLRAELQSSGVDAAQLDEQTLKQMMARVSRKEQFAIRVADIKAGRFTAGQTQPLVAQTEKEAVKTKRR
jgi:lipoprotein-anchoring transpeptidase ErfK/SrfK